MYISTDVTMCKEEDLSSKTLSQKKLKNIDNTEDTNTSVSTDCKSILTEAQNNSKKTFKYIPVDFVWVGEAKEVYLTGSFCQWTGTYMMQQILNTNIFKYTLVLPEGEYEYRFIVDGKMCILENKPKILSNDQKSMNNIIIVKKEEKVIKEGKKIEMGQKEKNSKKNKNKNNEIFDNSKNFLPFNLKIHSLSSLYKKLYEFKDENEDLTEKDSYKKIQREKIPFPFIDHLMSKEINENKTCMSCSMTKRAQKKLMTLVYYYPMSNK